MTPITPERLQEAGFYPVLQGTVWMAGCFNASRDHPQMLVFLSRWRTGGRDYEAWLAWLHTGKGHESFTLYPRNMQDVLVIADTLRANR